MKWPFWRKPSNAVAKESPDVGTPAPARISTVPQPVGPAGFITRDSTKQVGFPEWPIVLPKGDVRMPLSSPLSAAIEDFSFKLFREFSRSDADRNLFFSPASIMGCTGMIHELATGETRREIAKAIGIDNLEGKEADSVFDLLKGVFQGRDDVSLLAANSAWCSHHAHVVPECEARLREHYNAEFMAVDFSSRAPVAQINAWVTDKTKGKITAMVDHIDPLTAVICMNAIYFKGRWFKPFERKWTRDGAFVTAAGMNKTVPMMRQSDTFPYYEDGLLQAVELPYGAGGSAGHITMCIVLPAEGIAAQEFQKSLTIDSWRTWMARCTPVRGTIELPRFKVDYQACLNSVLNALGMKRAFDKQGAEFGGIEVDQPPVWVDRFFHKAIAEVNEEGTEAVAATSGFTVMFGRAERTFRMVVNRPFFLAIRDTLTDAILFMGWIDNPQ